MSNLVSAKPDPFLCGKIVNSYVNTASIGYDNIITIDNLILNGNPYYGFKAQLYPYNGVIGSGRYVVLDSYSVPNSITDYYNNGCDYITSPLINIATLNSDNNIFHVNKLQYPDGNASFFDAQLTATAQGEGEYRWFIPSSGK
jgi:hypothetical protein